MLVTKSAIIRGGEHTRVLHIEVFGSRYMRHPKAWEAPK